MRAPFYARQNWFGGGSEGDGSGLKTGVAPHPVVGKAAPQLDPTGVDVCVEGFVGENRRGVLGEHAGTVGPGAELAQLLGVNRTELAAHPYALGVKVLGVAGAGAGAKELTVPGGVIPHPLAVALAGSGDGTAPHPRFPFVGKSVDAGRGAGANDS